MNLRRLQGGFFDYLLIVLGTGLMAFSINSIYEPVNMVTGGVTGLAIIIKALTGRAIAGGIPVWLTNLALNVPLFLLGIRIKGVSFLKKTIISTLLLSAWLYILPVFPLAADDFFLATMFGGAIRGVGIGLVLMARSTTGGVDMAAALLQHYLSHYTIPQIMQVLDGLIVIAGAFIFGINRALYAVIAIIVTTRISDRLIEGFKFAKVAYIITEKPQEISDLIMNRMERGVTGLDAQGMYSGEKRFMLFCVVGKKEIVHLKELAREVDENAFVIVSDAREVLGEGFIEHNM